MFTITTLPTHGKLEWLSETAPEAVRTLETFWAVGINSFCGTEEHGTIFDNLTMTASGSAKHNLYVSSMLHGRSCYLGQCPKDKRYYFAKGIGWTQVNGYDLQNGLYGICPLREALYDKQAAEFQQMLGMNVVRPEAIFRHYEIPLSSGQTIHASQFDNDAVLAKPCMYVYSSPSRWRIADLQLLSDTERATVVQDNPKEYVRQLLQILSESIHLLHTAGGHNWTLSIHNAFTDGTRVDFEYIKLPNVPHKDEATENDTTVNKSKEFDGLREIALFLAELLRLNVSGKEVNEWCAFTTLI